MCKRPLSYSIFKKLTTFFISNILHFSFLPWLEFEPLLGLCSSSLVFVSLMFWDKFELSDAWPESTDLTDLGELSSALIGAKRSVVELLTVKGSWKVELNWCFFEITHPFLCWRRFHVWLIEFRWFFCYWS